MKLVDLVDRVKEEQQDDKRTRLAKGRDAILRDLRRGLSEEEYQALAAELRPRVEGYAIVWNRREIILSREGFMDSKHTEAKIEGGRFGLSFSKRIKNGRELLEFLAEVE